MNKRTYYKRMTSLGEKFKRVASDQDAYNRVVEEIKRTNHLWWVSLRRKRLLKVLFCWIIVLLFSAWILRSAWILYMMMSELP